MNRQDFLRDYYVERRNTNSIKWDGLAENFGDGGLTAMWVADMDFKTPQAVRQALQKRIEHGAFGYSLVPDSYYQAVSDWHAQRHGMAIDRQWLRFASGVVISLYWLINGFTNPGDSVIILTPVYYPFYNAILDTKRQLVTSSLQNKDGRYTVDFDDFEQKIIQNKVKLFIHCSPHNPVGRVWTEEESKTLFAICKRHNVLVISDEIHRDIVFAPHKHIPAILVDGGAYNDNLVIVSSASKSFNMAGMTHSQIIIPDEKIRGQYDSYAKQVNHAEVNAFAVIATEAAFTYGAEWFDCFLEVVADNYRYVESFLGQHLPKITVSPLEGTYLAWIDLRRYMKNEEIKSYIQDRCRLAVDVGEWFGVEGEGFIRINLATHPKHLQLAMENMAKHIQ